MLILFLPSHFQPPHHSVCVHLSFYPLHAILHQQWCLAVGDHWRNNKQTFGNPGCEHSYSHGKRASIAILILIFFSIPQHTWQPLKHCFPPLEIAHIPPHNYQHHTLPATHAISSRPLQPHCMEMEAAISYDWDPDRRKHLQVPGSPSEHRSWDNKEETNYRTKRISQPVDPTFQERRCESASLMKCAQIASTDPHSENIFSEPSCHPG